MDDGIEPDGSLLRGKSSALLPTEAITPHISLNCSRSSHWWVKLEFRTSTPAYSKGLVLLRNRLKLLDP